jgi:hypothetical protein
VTGEPLRLFLKHPELASILNKVNRSDVGSFSATFTSSRSYRYTDRMHSDFPQAEGLMPTGDKFKINTRAFEQLSFLFQEDEPSERDAYVRVAGVIKNTRVFRWVRREYVTGPAALGAFKVALSKASGSGEFGETFSPPLVLGPGVAVTGTFITVGSFATELEGQACVKYIKSKFTRALLGVLKVTQDNMARVWKHVPLQDFSSESDIDWSKSISEIDRQLFAKYEFDPGEITFIESHIKPMS